MAVGELTALHHTMLLLMLFLLGAAALPMNHNQGVFDADHKLQQHLHDEFSARHRRAVEGAFTTMSLTQLMAATDAVPVDSVEGEDSTEEDARLVRRGTGTPQDTGGDGDKCTPLALNGTTIKRGQQPFQMADSLGVLFFGAPNLEVLVIRYTDDIKPNLYVSTDYGVSYALANGIDEAVGHCAMSAAPTNQDDPAWLLCTARVSSKMYLSKDRGQTFSAVATPVPFYFFITHPQRTDWAIGAYLDSSMKVTVLKVYLCQNVGSGSPEFRLVKSDVYFVEWLAQDETVDKVDTILLTSFDTPPRTRVGTLSFYRFESPFEPQDLVLAHSACYKFYQRSKFIFVIQLPTSQYAEQTMLVSTDEGKTFTEAEFPIEGHENYYSVVDASEGMALVALQHTQTLPQGEAQIKLLGTTMVLPAHVGDQSAPILSAVDALLLFDRTNADGCNDFNPVYFTNNYALVFAGNCSVAQKMESVADAGGLGAVIINQDDVRIPPLEDEQDFEEPSDLVFVYISSSDGLALVRDVMSSGGDRGGTNMELSLISSEQALYSRTSLYASDDTGTKYTNVLKDVHFIPRGQYNDEVVDVYKVQCQQGTYIANIENDDNTLATVITFNKGAHWHKIPKPEAESCPDGQADCSLHISLEGGFKTYHLPGPLTTLESACVVVANGFVGNKVDDPSQANMYMSLDGGFTWTLQLMGPHMYRQLDHAGLIVAADAFGSQNNGVWFTDSYGYDGWQHLSLWAPSILAGLVAESSGKTLVVFAYRVQKTTQGFSLLADVLDFRSVLQTICTAADYQDFQPNGLAVADEQCLLGLRWSFVRRKPCRRCFSGLTFKSTRPKLSPCTCTTYDLQCGPGFVREHLSVPDQEAPPPKCIRDEEYIIDDPCKSRTGTVSLQQYTLVVGDGCSQMSSDISSKIAPQAVVCPSSTTSTSAVTTSSPTRDSTATSTTTLSSSTTAKTTGSQPITTSSSTTTGAKPGTTTVTTTKQTASTTAAKTTTKPTVGTTSATKGTTTTVYVRTTMTSDGAKDWTTAAPHKKKSSSAVPAIIAVICILLAVLIIVVVFWRVRRPRNHMRLDNLYDGAQSTGDIDKEDSDDDMITDVNGPAPPGGQFAFFSYNAAEDSDNERSDDEDGRGVYEDPLAHLQQPVPRDYEV